jgi:formate/nitrite transporter FocA (FNT family)
VLVPREIESYKGKTMFVDALVPADVARKAEALGVEKATAPALKLLVLGILAGAFIALGAIFATTITAGDGLSFGVARLLGGIVFSLGLILVILAGAELFTGNNLIVMAVASRKVTFAQLLRNWCIVYVGNFVGALGTALIVMISEQYLQGDGAVGARMLAIGAAKTQRRECRLYARRTIGHDELHRVGTHRHLPNAASGNREIFLVELPRSSPRQQHRVEN